MPQLHYAVFWIRGADFLVPAKLGRTGEQIIDRVGKGRKADVGKLGGLRSAGFLMLAMALDEDRLQAQIPAKFDVRKRIANDNAAFRRYFREIGLGLGKQSRPRFAAVALALVVWAKVEAVHMRA